MGFAAARALEPEAAWRNDFLAPLEAVLPAFRGALAAFPAAPAPLPADLDTPRATDLAAFLGPVPLASRFAAAAFLDALASTAPIAARMRLISRVTCSMVIMPSTVSSLRRSE